MENLSLYIVVFGITLLLFFGVPIIKVKKIKLNDFSDDFVRKIRRERPDIDMKCALLEGLKNVKADIDELYAHKEFYDYVVNLLRVQPVVKPCISLMLESFKDLSSLIKKPKRWWMLQYSKAGNDRKKAMMAILDAHYANFNNFKSLVDELRCLRINYESNYIDD